MIRFSGRTATLGAGATVLVVLGAGATLLTGLPGGSARADDALPPEKKAQIIKDCDDPGRVQDPNGTSQGTPGTIPWTIDNPSCDIEPVEDLGQTWGPVDTAWAEGKDKPVPACEAKTTASKSQGHTTGTNFFVGVSVGADKELPGKVKLKLDARFGWTFVDVSTTTYGESFEIEPYHMGWWEVRSALRKVKVDIDAKYETGDENEYKLEGVEMTVPDPGTQDAWVGRSREMTAEERKTFCGDGPAPSPTDSSSPTDTPSPFQPGTPGGPADSSTPQGTRSLVNVATGAAADVAGGRSELHAEAVNDADGQKWNIKPQDDGLVLLEPAVKPGWALGHNTDATKIDQGIQPYAFISQDARQADQRWRIDNAGGASYTIKDDAGDCLTAPGDQGGTIGVFGCTGGDLQRWRLGDAQPDQARHLEEAKPASTG